MSATTTSAPQPVLTPEVLAFAEEQGVSEILPRLIEMTRQVYPSATRFDVFVEDDPDEPFRYFVFELDTPLTVEQSLEADRQWGEGWQRIYPYPRTCMFCLSARLP
jgi:hypothetical protein